MKRLFAIPLFVIALISASPASSAEPSASAQLEKPRLWTSTSGAQIPALFVEISGDDVVLQNRNGEFIRINRFRLSETDLALLEQVFGEQEIELEERIAGDDAVGSAANEETFVFNLAPDALGASAAAPQESRTISFAGQELKTGEKNVILLRLMEDDIHDLDKSGNPDLTHAKFGIWLPFDFDPAGDWRIFVVSQTELNSNVDHMDCYLPAMLAAPGWIAIGADGTEMPPEADNNVLRWITLQAGLRAMEQAWPNVRQWPVVAGGFSGGAKRSGYIGALLMKNGWDLIGMYMGGCNQDMASKGLERYSPDKSTFRKTPIFLANGDKDETAPVSSGENVLREMKGNGFRRLRLMVYSGGHDPDTASIVEALNWFLQNRETVQESGTQNRNVRPGTSTPQRPQFQRQMPERPQRPTPPARQRPQRPAYTPPSQRR